MNAFINAWGLSSAFTFVVLIAAFIWQEAHIDSSIKNIERQYLVQSDLNGLTTSGMLSRSLYESSCCWGWWVSLRKTWPAVCIAV